MDFRRGITKKRGYKTSCMNPSKKSRRKHPQIQREKILKKRLQISETEKHRESKAHHKRHKDEHMNLLYILRNDSIQG